MPYVTASWHVYHLKKPRVIQLYPRLYDLAFFDIGTRIYALKKLKLKHQSKSCNKGCQNFCPMLQLYCMFLLYNNMNLIICFFLCLSSLTLISNSTFASELCKGLCKSVFCKSIRRHVPGSKFRGHLN